MAGTRSKAYQEKVAKVDREASYSPPEAVALAQSAARTTFDETVELHLRTNADPRHADQQLRGVAILPHGVGKEVRVAVFAPADAQRAANEAGADIVGDDDLVARVEGGFTEFDVAIATPDMMGKIGKLGRILGRRGLMPNPRTGTVVQPQDVASAVGEAKKGRVELRMDRSAIIHSPIGKASFAPEQLLANMTAVIDTINQLRPSAVKGQFVKTAYLTTTMGPGVPLDVGATMSLRTD